MLKFAPNGDEFFVLNMIAATVRYSGTKETDEKTIKAWAHLVQGNMFRLEWYYYGPNLDEDTVQAFGPTTGGYISRYVLSFRDWVYDWPLKNQFFEGDPAFPKIDDRGLTQTPASLVSGAPATYYRKKSDEGVGEIRCMDKIIFDRDILFLKMVLSDDR